jgi:hypothetical protein
VGEETVSVISDGFEVAKLINKGMNVEAYEKMGKFIDEIQDLYAQREMLQEENKELKRQLEFGGKFVRISRCTYVEGDNEPVCSRCAEVDRKPVHLTQQMTPKMGPQYVCPECKSTTTHYRFRRDALEDVGGTEK